MPYVTRGEKLSLIWRCIVTDATGHTAISQTAGYRYANSTDPIVITNQPDNAYCAIKGTASFEVEATGTGLTYRWLYSPNGGVTWSQSNNPTATTAELIRSNMDEYHLSLLWKCKITDSSGNVTYSRIVSFKRSSTRWRNVYDLDGLRAKRTNGETTYEKRVILSVAEGSPTATLRSRNTTCPILHGTFPAFYATIGDPSARFACSG